MGGYYEDNERQIRESYKNHKAKLHKDTENITRIIWKRPGTNNCYVEYIIIGGTLFVHGDYGAAVYHWHGGVGLASFAKMNLGYFSEKCEASPGGRNFKSYDPDQAQIEFDKIINDKDFADEYGEDVDMEALRQENPLFDDKHEWHEWLRNDAEKYFGQDWWESDVVRVGENIDYFCQAHLVGLKMAYEQVREEG